MTYTLRYSHMGGIRHGIFCVARKGGHVALQMTASNAYFANINVMASKLIFYHRSHYLVEMCF